MKPEKKPSIIKEVCRIILAIYGRICCDIAIALQKDKPQMLIRNFLLLILVTAFVVAIPVLIFAVIAFFPRIRALLILAGVIWAVIFSIGGNHDDTDDDDDDGDTGGVEEEVERELIEQRAMEQQEQVESLMFLSIQGAATTTPLLRPHDVFEIMTAGSSRRFYMDKDIPVLHC